MPKVLDPEGYFWSKVEVTGFCWNWRGVVDGNGYGSIKQDRIAFKAHRKSYEYLVGGIPDGFLLDHLCRNRICVNPDHLEPVTARENILRGYGTGAQFARRETCSGCGGTNFTIRSDGGRRCKTCVNERNRRRRDNLRGGPPRKWARKNA